MYFTLIGTFVIRRHADVVLLHNQNNTLMNPEFLNRQTIISDFQKKLIEACKMGDHKARLQVYKIYYKPVYNLCLLIVSDPMQAEALMHESFLTAFENIGSYQEKISFSYWLLNFIKFPKANGTN